MHKKITHKHKSKDITIAQNCSNLKLCSPNLTIQSLISKLIDFSMIKM